MKIAFASCMRRETFREQPVWREVLAADPDCLLLLGDQIYMDYGLPGLSPEPLGAPRGYDAMKFRQVMAAKYAAQWAEPNFRALIEHMRAKNAFLATWDDHDFAWNGARGKSVPAEKRAVARKLFNRWVYGQESDAEVFRYADFALARIIMLDTRYYADEPGPEAELLGAAQWRFLERALQHERPYTVVCSGQTIDRGFDSWAQYPKEYARLRKLLALRQRVLFLTGDIHQNRFACHNGVSTIYEITSSGAAVNPIGLPFGIAARRNWGLIELGEADVVVRLNSRRGNVRRQIDTLTWNEVP